MSTDRILVTVIGVLVCAWVLWYFLAPPRPAAAAKAAPPAARRQLNVLP